METIAPTPGDVARFWAKVEKTATCWNWMAGTRRRGYGLFHVGGSGTSAHRFSYELAKGPIPAGRVIDHTCHNTACVNPAHLRAVATKGNNENKTGANRNSKSGVQGVTWHKSNRRWQATVRHNGKKLHVGYFATVSEAEASAIAKRNELFEYNDSDRVA